MKLVELSDLVRRLGLEAYKKQYPDPALVLLTPVVASADPNSETATDQNDASPLPSSRMRTKIDDAEERELQRTFRLDATAEVVFISKSTRNPFLSMITLGRATNNDLVLPVGSVSKLHVSFGKSPAGWTITDHKAVNGTVVGGKRLAPSTPLPLMDGVVIDFGFEVRAHFHTPDGLVRMATTLA